ncbi:MAG: glycosyltransferase family 87 protein [Solirubrobacteraceae bacterium]
MGQNSNHTETTAVLASAPAAASRPESVVFGRLGLPLRVALPRLNVATGPLAGRLALTSLVLGALALVALSTGRASVLVPRSSILFPHWEAGPLHFLLGQPRLGPQTLNIAFSAFLIAMTAAYGLALVAVRTLSMRAIAISVVALHAILLLGPPLQLTDLFNYLGYARLGGLHGLNPYTHGMHAEMHDPVYRFTSWHNLKSPYGPLFTALSYPLAQLSLPVAYWLLKSFVVLGSLVFIWLVWKCARLLGRDPRFAVLFVAANPVYLFFALGGFHNDFFMLVPSTAAVTLLLARRDRSAGAMLMAAVAVKFSAILLLPFLLIAARPPERRLRVLAGCAAATVPLALLSVAVFGFTAPNLSDQSTLLTDFSVPNLVGILLGIGGGTPGLLRVANVVLVLAVLLLLRRRDWISSSGWATIALVASLAWLVPWYIVWALPLAALGTSIWLRRAAVAFTVFLVIAFMPATGMFLSAHGIDLMGSSVGQASLTLQNKLAQ